MRDHVWRARPMAAAVAVRTVASFGCDSVQGFLFGHPQVEPCFDLGGLRPLRERASTRRHA